MHGKNFRNEVVPLDGYDYVDCTFQNVTFLYDGITPVKLTHSTWSNISVKSNNNAANGTAALLYGLGLIKTNVGFHYPPGSKIEPPTPEPNSPTE